MRIEELQEKINSHYKEYINEQCKVVSKENNTHELTVIAQTQKIKEFCQRLKEDLNFTLCMDLCAVDYLHYKNSDYRGKRFAVVVHLLNIKDNLRLRLRYFAEDDEFPIVPSIMDVWNSVNWYEREAFDLFGIIFEGHPDLRRILTDYGFVGHPFRKDFPISGYAEMRYDPSQERVIYQPVTIEARQLTPRIIREENYAKIKI